MSTPPSLSPENQKAVLAIQDACAALALALSNASTQTTVPQMALAKVVLNNFAPAQANRRLEELTALIHERVIRRSIAAKLTTEERTYIGLKGDGVDNVPEPVAAAAQQGGGKP